MAKILGVITARGGSKGIPGKNIKSLLGKPLLAYTIEAAQESGVFDRLILSTDDEAIANVAREYGCEVPFMRPANLADDQSAHLPVVQHAVKWLQEHDGYDPDYVMILQPTSPLRTSQHIRDAVDLIIREQGDSVLSVAEIPENFNPFKAMVLAPDGGLILFNGNPVRSRTARRQDLPLAYWSVGSIYLFKKEVLFSPEGPSFYGNRVLPLVIDKERVVDINVPEDWEEAERALKKLTSNS